MTFPSKPAPLVLNRPAPLPLPSKIAVEKVGYDCLEVRIDTTRHTMTRHEAFRFIGELERIAASL